MTVKQALKVKNRLVKEINEKFEILKKYNSIDQDNTRRYSMSNILSEIGSLTEELVVLKAKIHKANLPVYDKIFKLSELKSHITQIQNIPTEEGKTVQAYGSVVTYKNSELSVIDVENVVKRLQTEIDKLQDDLDIHNLTTEIE